MSIVYTEELDMIHEKSIISERVDFDPAVYIYIQKLMKEKSKSFNEIINDLIRKHALNEFKNRIVYVPYVQPTTVPSINPYPFYDPNKVTYTGSINDYYSYSYDNNTGSGWLNCNYKPKRM